MTLLRKIAGVNGPVLPGTHHQAGGLPATANRSLLEKLREKVALIENREPQFTVDEARPFIGQAELNTWCFGLPDIDARLPDGRLTAGAVHEIAAAGYGETPAAMGFALALSARLLAARPHDPRPVLWCRHVCEVQEFGTLYGAGLDGLGLPRERLITVTLRKARTVLWTVEEALKSGTVAAVMTDMDIAACDLTATRRLALIAAEAHAPVLLIAGKPPCQATSARTRWRIAAAPSIPPPFDDAAPGAPAWTIELVRCRGGKSGKWSLVWHHATHSFCLASSVSYRTADRRTLPGRLAASS